jgi:hypothetical protein
MDYLGTADVDAREPPSSASVEGSMLGTKKETKPVEPQREIQREKANGEAELEREVIQDSKNNRTETYNPGTDNRNTEQKK